MRVAAMILSFYAYLHTLATCKRDLQATSLQLLQHGLRCCGVSNQSVYHLHWSHNRWRAETQLAVIGKHHDVTRALHHQTVQRGRLIVQLCYSNIRIDSSSPQDADIGIEATDRCLGNWAQHGQFVGVQFAADDNYRDVRRT